MSYQVIARKWRPQKFEELVGQRHITQSLRNALLRGRLAHALLLTGPRGTGKTSTARILAKSLRCPNAIDFVPCNQCPECNDIGLGRSLNVIEIDGASNNGVDAIRELRETVGYMPSSGQHKLYIIDEVHMLSTSAFNALLKTLEEPPAHVVFVFATTEAQKIPQTILSRCQRMDFRRIPSREIMQRLLSICDSEGVKIDQEALWVVARQGDGSMRDSQSLLDQVITYCDGQNGEPITSAQVNEVLGLTDRHLLVTALQALAERKSAEILDVINGLFESGADPKGFIQDLLEELRHLILVKVSDPRTASLIDLPDTEIEQLNAISESLSEDDIQFMFDMALKGAQDLLRAQDPRIVLEMVLLRMSMAPQLQSLVQWASTNTEPQQPPVSPSSQTAPTPTPTPTPTRTTQSSQASAARPPKPSAGQAPKASPSRMPSAPAVAPESTRPLAENTTATPEQKWFQFVKRVNGVNAMLAAKLAHAHLMGEDASGKILSVGIPNPMKFIFDQLSSAQSQDLINGYASQFWADGYQVQFHLDGVDQPAQLSPKALEEKRKREREEKIKSDVEKHPLVRSVRDTFKAEIKSIKSMEKSVEQSTKENS